MQYHKPHPTERQVEALKAISAYIHNQGWPPSIRDVMALMGVSSLRGAACHLIALERKGFIERGGAARQIRITEKGKRLLRGFTEPLP